jgi:hypothetical protein
MRTVLGELQAGNTNEALKREGYAMLRHLYSLGKLSGSAFHGMVLSLHLGGYALSFAAKSSLNRFTFSRRSLEGPHNKNAERRAGLGVRLSMSLRSVLASAIGCFLLNGSMVDESLRPLLSKVNLFQASGSIDHNCSETLLGVCPLPSRVYPLVNSTAASSFCLCLCLPPPCFPITQPIL